MGLPFFRFLNTSDTAIYPIGCKYPTPYPGGFPDKFIEQFDVVFGDRLTCYDYPQGWLAEWWAFLRRNVERWTTLLDTNGMLAPEDALYTDKRTFERQETSTDDASGSVTSDVTSETSNTVNNYVADVPDDQVPNVDDYYSIGAGGKTTVSSSDGETRTTKQQKTGNKTVTETYTGRAGKSPASLVSSYRSTISYNAWDVIFQECDKMFIGVYEGGDYYGFYYD